MNICNDNRRAFSDRLLPSAAAAVVLSAMALPSARATEWYAVYNDTATIRANYTLTESGVTYEIANNGSYNAPTLFATGAYSGTKSLKIGVPTTTTVTAPDGKTTDRFEYEWVQATDSLAPRFDGVERYWGFAFKIIGSKSQAPTNGGIIFAQLWQGSPYAPPIRLDLKAPSLAGNPWPNRLFIQNSDTGQNTDDVPIKLYDSTIPVDVWYTYVVGVRPGYDGTGHIDLWVNGVQVVNYTGKIGYKPYSVGGLPGTNDSLMVKSGVYRNRPNPNVTFGFDNIKYADNHSQAARKDCIAHKSLEIFERRRLWQQNSPAMPDYSAAFFLERKSLKQFVLVHWICSIIGPLR